MRAKATAMLFVATLVLGSWMSGILVGLTGRTFMAPSLSAAASEQQTTADSKTDPVDLPPKDEIPPYLVEDLEEEQELEELALEKFEYAWIEDAKFVVYTTPYPANNCDSWCGLTAYRLEFKGGMGAKLAYLALVPPNIPRTARCTQLGYSRGHELSANGLGDIASGVFCADEAYEAITYEWVSENLVTGVMVSGYRDRLDKGEVKAFTDKLYNDSKNLFQKEKFQ